MLLKPGPFRGFNSKTVWNCEEAYRSSAKEIKFGHFDLLAKMETNMRINWQRRMRKRTLLDQNQF